MSIRNNSANILQHIKRFEKKKFRLCVNDMEMPKVSLCFDGTDTVGNDKYLLSERNKECSYFVSYTQASIIHSSNPEGYIIDTVPQATKRNDYIRGEEKRLRESTLLSEFANESVAILKTSIETSSIVDEETGTTYIQVKYKLGGWKSYKEISNLLTFKREEPDSEDREICIPESVKATINKRGEVVSFSYYRVNYSVEDFVKKITKTSRSFFNVFNDLTKNFAQAFNLGLLDVALFDRVKEDLKSDIGGDISFVAELMAFNVKSKGYVFAENMYYKHLEENSGDAMVMWENGGETVRDEEYTLNTGETLVLTKGVVVCLMRAFECMNANSMLRITEGLAINSRMKRAYDAVGININYLSDYMLIGARMSNMHNVVIDGYSKLFTHTPLYYDMFCTNFNAKKEAMIVRSTLNCNEKDLGSSKFCHFVGSTDELKPPSGAFLLYTTKTRILELIKFPMKKFLASRCIGLIYSLTDITSIDRDSVFKLYSMTYTVEDNPNTSDEKDAGLRIRSIIATAFGMTLTELNENYIKYKDKIPVTYKDLDLSKKVDIKEFPSFYIEPEGEMINGL